MFDLPGAGTLWDALPEARIVGGAVRDTLANRPVADIDFASPLRPEQVIIRLRDKNIKTIPTGLAHGTVTAVIAGRAFEITTLRHDVETDGRRALVAFTSDWEADASRRDFTINAMSASRDGTIYDYHNGRNDLATGHVRFVGGAAVRIQEDFLRILRFFRFQARYGNAGPDQDAIAAITLLKDGIRQLSAERIWSELRLLLLAEAPGAAFALMQTTGVLPIILRQPNLANFNALLARGAPPDPLLRIAALSDEAIAAFAARLKLSGAEQERLTALRGPNLLTPAASDADLRRALAATNNATLIGQTWLAQNQSPGWPDLRERIAATPRPVFPLQGRDLTARGIPPGPQIGQTLAKIHAWWLAGGCVASAQTCLEQLHKP